MAGTREGRKMDETLTFMNSPYNRKDKLYMEFSRRLNTVLLMIALRAKEGASNLALEK